MPSILQDWVERLPIRHQGVLVAAVRGCDGVPKENSAKPITRAIRGAFMRPADEREVGLPSSFLTRGFTDDEARAFLRDWDHYPIHFVTHLMGACEVLGYKHPEAAVRMCFLSTYRGIALRFHLHPENEAEMDARLTEDRIALYGGATDLQPGTGGAYAAERAWPVEAPFTHIGRYRK